MPVSIRLPPTVSRSTIAVNAAGILRPGQGHRHHSSSFTHPVQVPRAWPVDLPVAAWRSVAKRRKPDFGHLPPNPRSGFRPAPTGLRLGRMLTDGS
jgi:hypothetical protein